MKFAMSRLSLARLARLARGIAAGVAMVAWAGVSPAAGGEVCNLKVVTDASPDYTDLPSLVHSETARWSTPAEKCWAVYYWNHIARRQTAPMILHGTALADPIRQFNDYGYTMCSTISGINQSIWEAMGLQHRYWDISNHTVGEVFYDGRWHMYDNSMSALYTLCDGKTIASVEDIGKENACEASGGKVELGHVAKYHCLTGTSPNGFLCGADTARSLAEESRCFSPNGLKLRKYYYDWDNGHRYILNLRDGETYARTYHGLGDSPEFYVPLSGHDPEKGHPDFHQRGNGLWVFKPSLAGDAFKSQAYSHSEIQSGPAGLTPVRAGVPARVVYKVESANVTTSQAIDATIVRTAPGARAAISVSTDNGINWNQVWKADGPGDEPAHVKLVDEVSGAYEVLVRVEMETSGTPQDVALKSLEIRTTTQLNAKTQPRLNLGRNTVYVGAGDATESIVFWPELQAGRSKAMVAEEHNVGSVKKHPGYMGCIYPATPKEEGYQVYRIDAPSDLKRITYGGRFCNRTAGSHIDLLHSFDDGKTWARSWTITRSDWPADVIHYETVDVPAGHRSALVKYLMYSPVTGEGGASIYALRVEGDYAPADPTPAPVEVTFTWKERQADYSLVERSHTQTVDKLPAKYTLDVGGVDHPVMESLTVNLKGARGPATQGSAQGYSDGKDVGGERFVGRWVTSGRDLALGKKYTLSVPPIKFANTGDPEGTRLTDGVIGPDYAGGTAPDSGPAFDPKHAPEITVDLEQVQACGAFRIHMNSGSPWPDALQGQWKEKVELLTSVDGKEFTSRGFFDLNLRLKDVPVNHMLPDAESARGWNFELVPPKPVAARYVRYKVTPNHILSISEVQVLDGVKYEPFDLKVALPDEAAGK